MNISCHVIYCPWLWRRSIVRSLFILLSLIGAVSFTHAATPVLEKNVTTELLALDERGELTVRALRGWNQLPAPFMQLVLDLNREGIDLLGVDRNALMVLIDKARQEGAGPIYSRLNGLQELLDHMNHFAAQKPSTNPDILTEISLPSNLALPSPIKSELALPVARFSATDPCAAVGKKEGLPWDLREVSVDEDFAESESLVPTLAIPNLHQLSQAGYNSAVSIAFEGMRLVYGPMSDEQTRGFEAAWIPLFDYPTQEIVDYLNLLNPLLSQFLAYREAYIRTLQDLQFLLMDAAMAIEGDDRIAWESAMAQAGLNASVLERLELSMTVLARRIEVLGNPPDPNAAKCEAQTNYRRLLSDIKTNECSTALEGVWIGFSEGHVGNEFLEKRPVAIMFYTMLMQNPFLDEPTCHIEGYSLQENVFGYSPEWAGQSIAAWDSPFSEIQWKEEMLSGISEDGMRLQYEYVEHVGEVSGLVRVVMEKASNDLPDLVEGADVKRLHTLKKIYDEIRNELNTIPASFTAGLDINNPVDRHAAGVHYERSPEYSALAERLNRCSNAIRWLENMLEGVPVFHLASLRWFENLPYDINRLESAASNQRKIAFSRMMQEEFSASALIDSKRDVAIISEGEESKEISAINDQQAIRDSIAFHTEMMGVIQHNIDRDIRDRNLARLALANAKTAEEAKDHTNRIKELDLRIMHHQSNLQAEQDLINTHKTGELVRTRTAFDEYARHLFIQSIRENAARMDATRRIAERIDRQIELLPEEVRESTRARVYNHLDPQTVASGDIEKARRIVAAINEQIQGYAQYDHALAKEAEVDAQQHEFYAQMTILATGAVFSGLGSSALVSTYGAQTATAVYGTKALGAVYGGTTGFIAGGPADGVKQSVSNWSPVGSAAVQFLDGFQKAGLQPNVSISDQVWEGVKQAGTGYLTGKAFELGTRLVTQGSMVMFGKESRLFKPIISPPSQRTSQMLDGMRTQQAKLNAQDEIATFRSLESELNILKINPNANAAKIAQLEAQLNNLAAGLNMSYHAKWHLKYKADPLTRMRFDRRLQQQYSKMTPGMIQRLEQQGYNMDGIEFKQFRNSSSSGSSSMDLDLGPVMSSTGAEPGIVLGPHKLIVKKDGSVVTLAKFNEDAQSVMNAEWRELTGMSATLSDMNLTTTAHREAFSTPLLLDHNIDFSTFTSEEVASVAKVLEVKMEGINKNKMLTQTSKMQAKSREASKEIQNMLSRKLKSDLAKAPVGSAERSQIEADIKYWEDMLQRFQRIGSDESNPAELIRLNREMMHETGGRDVNGVISDLISKFN